MINLLLMLLLLGNPELAFTQDSANERSEFKRHNLSIGMLDDKTGFSMFGYTYNIKQNKMNEYFIGCGTMILAYTGTVGWKHYYRKAKLSISSVLSAQYVAHLGFMGFLPTASITVDYDIAKWAQIKLGAWGFMLLGGTSGESGGNIGALPFIGLNFRF